MLMGFATYYRLSGRKTAFGEMFDPDAMTAAMAPSRASLGDTVQVALAADTSRVVDGRINDTEPFLRNAKGRAVHPLQPDPNIIIDLTPAAFTALCGSLAPGKVLVTVTVGS